MCEYVHYTVSSKINVLIKLIVTYQKPRRECIKIQNLLWEHEKLI